jgi:hypothetical protein
MLPPKYWYLQIYQNARCLTKKEPNPSIHRREFKKIQLRVQCSATEVMSTRCRRADSLQVRLSRGHNQSRIWISQSSCGNTSPTAEV